MMPLFSLSDFNTTPAYKPLQVHYNALPPMPTMPIFNPTYEPVSSHPLSVSPMMSRTSLPLRRGTMPTFTPLCAMSPCQELQ